MHVFHHTKTHDDTGAVRPEAKVSGNAYVSVQLRGEKVRGRVLLMASGKCNHGVTICELCAESWEIDHVVYYRRTAAGRALRERLDRDPPGPADSAGTAPTP